jgi:hypothetical protein
MVAGAVGLLIGLFQEIVWSRRTRPVAPGEVPPPAVEERREVRDPGAPPRY